MYPTLLSWGELRFHSYTVMLTLAFLIGAIGPNWLNSRRAEPFRVSPAGGIWVFLGGILGAKVYWMAQYGGWEDLRYFQFILTGGLVFFGGLIGGILAGIGYLKYAKAPILPSADMVAPFLALAHGIGRIGCFLNGCCWGNLATFQWPWTVSYPQATYGPYREQVLDGLIKGDVPYSLPVHPVQLYETSGLFLISILLMVIYKRHRHTGVVALSYLTMYGVLRLVTEAFRGESARPVFGLLTVSQTIGLALFLVAGTTLFLLKKTVWKDAPADAPTVEAETPEVQP